MRDPWVVVGAGAEHSVDDDAGAVDGATLLVLKALAQPVTAAVLRLARWTRLHPKPSGVSLEGQEGRAKRGVWVRSVRLAGSCAGRRSCRIPPPP